LVWRGQNATQRQKEAALNINAHHTTIANPATTRAMVSDIAVV
jgi:hypothetical protein